jgi:hypothetical protein
LPLIHFSIRLDTTRCLCTPVFYALTAPDMV